MSGDFQETNIQAVKTNNGLKFRTIHGDNLDDQLNKGPFLLVIHPGLDTKEMKAIYLKGHTPSEEVAKTRTSETAMLTSSEFRKLLVDHNLSTTNYQHILKKQ